MINLKDEHTRFIIKESLQNFLDKKKTANKRAGVPETMEELTEAKTRIGELETIENLLQDLVAEDTSDEVDE